MDNKLKKIIVTGATSMIGMALIEVCLKHNIEVHAIIRPGTNRQDRIIKDNNVHYHLSSLDDLLNIQDLPSDCDVFYHFAWAGTDHIQRNDPDVQSKNIRYALDSVKLAKKCGCSKYIGAGSQAEYGPCESVIDEHTLHNPVTAYGAAKYAASVLCKKLCQQLDMIFVWGRICSVYGPHDNSHTMLMYAIDCFKKGITAKFSEGNQLWNFLYESDAGVIFYKFSDDKVSEGEYLVASEESMPLKEYLNVLIDCYPDKVHATFGNSPNKSSADSNNDNLIQSIKSSGNNKVFSLNVNANNTFNTINYHTKVSFRTGILNTIKFIMNKDNLDDVKNYRVGGN